MRLSKIQLSRVAATLHIVLLSAGGMLTSSRVSAQCAGTIQSTTYSTTYGATVTNPNNLVQGSYSYPLPQFPTSTSTLVSVVIKSKVTASAVVVVQNNTANPITTPFVSLFRSDGVTSTPVNTGAAAVSNPVFGTPLASGASETINMPNALNNYPIINDSIQSSAANFSDFTGSGIIPITYSDNNVPLPSSGLTVTSTTITDVINFSITYYFCVPGTLATDILTFTATRENAQTALLSWTASNEQAGRYYVIQTSTDGKDFTDSATVPGQGAAGDAAYNYNFPLDPRATGTLYFRLRVVDPIGPNHYSQLAIIDLGNATATSFSIYPNPPGDFINISLPGDNQNWDIQIYAADGNLVQRNYYPITNLIHLNFNRKMAAGTYFVRAINPQTNLHYTASFIIRD